MADRAPSVPRQGLLFFDYVTHFGGAQQSTVTLLSHLAPFYDVHVADPYGVCRDWLRALMQARVPVHVLQPHATRCFIGHEDQPLRRITSLLAQVPHQMELRRKLRRQVVKLDPSVILTNSIKGLALLWIAGAFARHRIALYARGWYLRGQIPAWGRGLVRKANCVLAVSTATAQALRTWGVAADRIHVVHTLIDCDEVWRDGQACVTDGPPRPDGPCRILLPGQYHRAKGQHTAVQAARHLLDRGLDFVMWLAGDVKMGSDEPYREDLVRSIRQHQLGNHVFLLGHRPDVRALMRLADIVILPTQSEGFPRAVWEAQVLERPVLSTPVGGVTDLIQDGQTGLLVPVENSRGLADGIERLWTDKDLCKRIVQNAACQIRSQFSSKRQVEALRIALEPTR